MAYSTNNRPFLVVPAVAGGFGGTILNSVPGSSDCGGNVWAYRSSDTVGTVMGANYFSDGFKMGLRKGDFMFVTQFSTALAVSAGGIGIVNTVNASSAATLGILFSSSTS
jgi:hypothetical protein